MKRTADEEKSMEQEYKDPDLACVKRRWSRVIRSTLKGYVVQIHMERESNEHHLPGGFEVALDGWAEITKFCDLKKISDKERKRMRLAGVVFDGITRPSSKPGGPKACAFPSMVLAYLVKRNLRRYEWKQLRATQRHGKRAFQFQTRCAELAQRIRAGDLPILVDVKTLQCKVIPIEQTCIGQIPGGNVRRKRR